MSNRFSTPVLFLVGAVVCQIGHGLAVGAADLPTIENVKVGFHGRFKLGRFTPVAITLRGSSINTVATVFIETPDGNDARSQIAANSGRPVAIPANQNVTVTGYTKIGRRDARLRVLLRLNDGGEIANNWRIDSAEQPRAVLATQQLVVTVGATIGVEDAIRIRHRRPLEQIVAVTVESATELPSHWIGYDGVDLLVLSTGRTQWYEPLHEKQAASLARWIALGGRAIACASSNSVELMGPRGKLHALSPGRPDGTKRLDDTELTALEEFAGATNRIQLRNNDPAGAVARFSPADGKVLLSATNLIGEQTSLLIRFPRGLGQVLLCTVDLDSGAFQRWPDRIHLVARLIDIMLGTPVEELQDQQSGKAAHYGYVDLSGQLRSSLERFPGVTLIPFSLVAVLAAVYVLLIGPLDYFLLRRTLGRAGWTWITFPAFIVLITFIAFAMERTWKSSSRRLNQVDLVDLDVATGSVRGTTWAHVYSPTTRTFDLELRIASPIESPSRQTESFLTWQGLAGSAYGGMNTTPKVIGSRHDYELLWNNEEEAALSLAMRAVPIETGSTRCLLGNWQTEFRGDRDVSLTALRNGRLRGTFTNPIPVDLKDCWFVYGRWCYRVRGLEIGEVIDFQDMSPERLDFLLSRRQFNEESKAVTTPWDRRNLDIPRILEMLMFHEIGGGASYTRLLHRQHGHLDLSDHLALNRAMFIGRADRSATRVTMDGAALPSNQVAQWTFYRTVIPIHEETHDAR